MKLSTRNQIPGTIEEITRGSTVSQIKVNVGNLIVHSAITNDASDDLALKVGDKILVVIKASDVMIGK